LTNLEPERNGLPRGAREAVSREKRGENISKTIGLFYVWSMPAVGEYLFAVDTSARCVLIEDRADLGDHRLGWVDFFPWPNRYHTDLPEIPEVYS
jgi:hypothetical protein